MTASVGNWVGEVTTTTGTGAITLGGAKAGGFTTFSSIRDTFNIGNNGEFFYAIVEGENREAGRGMLVSPTVFERLNITSTLENGIYSDNNPDPINLKGNAEIFATFNKEAFDEILKVVVDLATLPDEFKLLQAEVDQKVDKRGDAITGAVTAPMPTNPDELANKVYVDTEVSKSKVFLGEFAAEPTPASLGIATFTSGQMYYNTTLQGVYVYKDSTGTFSSFVSPTPAVLSIYKYKADGIKKTFSGVDLTGKTFSPIDAIVNPIKVYISGILQTDTDDYTMDYTTKVLKFTKVPRKDANIEIDVLVDPTAATKAVEKHYITTTALNAVTGATTLDKLTNAFAPDGVKIGAKVLIGVDPVVGSLNNAAGVWVYDGAWRHIIDLNDVGRTEEIHHTTAIAVKAKATTTETDGAAVLDAHYAALFPSAAAPQLGDLVAVEKGEADSREYAGTFRFNGATWETYSPAFSVDYIEGYVKALKTLPDNSITTLQIPEGSIQATTNAGTRELKIAIGSTWFTLFSEEEIDKKIAAGAQNKGVVSPVRTYTATGLWYQGQIVKKGAKYFQCINTSEKGITETGTYPDVTPDGDVDPDKDPTNKYWQEVRITASTTSTLPYVLTLPDLPDPPTTADVGVYWVFQDNQPYELTAADGQLFTDLGGLTLTSGDWLQVTNTSGTPKWNWVNGNYLQRDLWERFGTFDNIYQAGQGAIKGSLIRWRKTGTTDAMRWYRARDTIAAGTTPASYDPSDSANSIWEDITPQVAPTDLAGLDPTANTAIDRGLIVYNATTANWQITDTYQVPLLIWYDTITFIEGQLTLRRPIEGTDTYTGAPVVFRALRTNSNSDPLNNALGDYEVWDSFTSVSEAGKIYLSGDEYWLANTSGETGVTPTAGTKWTKQAYDWEVLASVRLNTLADVNAINLKDKDLLVYDEDSEKYVTTSFKEHVVWDGLTEYKEGDVALLLSDTANGWYVAANDIPAPTSTVVGTPPTPNAAPNTDTTNWVSAGGALSIGDLEDVDTTGHTFVDDDALLWSVADAAFKPKKLPETGGIKTYSLTLEWKKGSYVEYNKRLYKALTDIPANIAPDATISHALEPTGTATGATLTKADLDAMVKNSLNPAVAPSYSKVDVGTLPAAGQITIDTGELEGLVIGESTGWLILLDKVDGTSKGVNGYWFVPSSDGQTPLNPATNAPKPTTDIPEYGFTTNPWELVGGSDGMPHFPITYIGNVALVAADIADPTQNYGMPATTAPDPVEYPPRISDTYINTADLSITRFN